MQQTLPVYDAVDVCLDVLRGSTFLQWLPPDHEFDRCDRPPFLKRISRLGGGHQAD